MASRTSGQEDVRHQCQYNVKSSFSDGGERHITLLLLLLLVVFPRLAND